MQKMSSIKLKFNDNTLVLNGVQYKTRQEYLKAKLNTMSSLGLVNRYTYNKAWERIENNGRKQAKRS